MEEDLSKTPAFPGSTFDGSRAEPRDGDVADSGSGPSAPPQGGQVGQRRDTVPAFIQESFEERLSSSLLEGGRFLAELLSEPTTTFAISVAGPFAAHETGLASLCPLLEAGLVDEIPGQLQPGARGGAFVPPGQGVVQVGLAAVPHTGRRAPRPPYGRRALPAAARP